jgi:hypothetical protein
MSAGYAKAGYSGDDTMYWGGPAARARRTLFANATTSDPSWSNMDAYRCGWDDAAHLALMSGRCTPGCSLAGVAAGCLRFSLRAHSCSWHTYGKTGSQMRTSYNAITAGLAADGASDLAPIWITEHQAHTSLEWDTTNSTTDDDFEASRVASQIMWMVSVGGGRRCAVRGTRPPAPLAPAGCGQQHPPSDDTNHTVLSLREYGLHPYTAI